MRGKKSSIRLRALAIFAVTLSVTSICAAANWNEKVLHNFNNDGTDGASPASSLTFDGAGNLYGTTSAGGVNNAGTVFKLTPNGSGGWTETVLYSFCSQAQCKDGANPLGSLVIDAAGNLYGTTLYGGNYSTDCRFFSYHGCGIVFELMPNGDGGWTRTVLYTFCSQGYCADGANPAAGLIFDAAGNLYGTAEYGGEWGEVFELSPSAGGVWRERVLHYFGNGPDGAIPFAGLVFDGAGNLYGTTKYGGRHPCEGIGCGTVFVLNGESERVLHSFADDGTDGYYPLASLTFCAGGNLCGTTETGGAYGGGIAFGVTLSGAESVLHSFNPGSGTDGAYPLAGLIADTAGNLYGTTAAGGVPYNDGTFFELSPGSGHWTETVLYNFGANGAGPAANLISDSAGNLYGTTQSGGTYGYGTVFELMAHSPCAQCNHTVLK